MKTTDYPRYRRSTKAKQNSDGGGRRLAICLILCACALLCKLRYPRGVEAIQDLLTGREGGRVQSAFSAMTEALDEGSGLGGAVQAFWIGMSRESET